MEHAILQLRMRIRYGEEVALDEVHDLPDALHNIPALLRGDGDWFTEENIGNDLARSDGRWMERPSPKPRISLVRNLELARQGEIGAAFLQRSAEAEDVESGASPDCGGM